MLQKVKDKRGNFLREAAALHVPHDIGLSISTTLMIKLTGHV
jgi:hypothetical protein